MRISSQDLKSRTDLDETIGENPLEELLVRLIYKFTKSVTEISSKVQESKISNKTINNSIHRNRF